MTCQVVVTQEENWFVATDTTTNIASQGKSIAESLNNLKEALELYHEDSLINEDVRVGVASGAYSVSEDFDDPDVYDIPGLFGLE